MSTLNFFRSRFIGTLVFALVFIPAAVSAVWIKGVEAIKGPLPYYDGTRTVRVATTEDPVANFQVILGRCRYWQEDGHIEVVVLMRPPVAVDLDSTELVLELKNSNGEVVASGAVTDLPSAALALYPGLPVGFAGDGSLAVKWMDGEKSLASEVMDFRVEVYEPRVVADDGIRVELANGDGVHLKGYPVSVGVPFPRGMVDSVDHLRIVDTEGRIVPAQAEALARWSKYGTLKWVRFDFTADLAGESLSFYVEQVATSDTAGREALSVSRGSVGLPMIDAGLLKIEDGLWYRPRHSADWTKVLSADALSGGFVEHEDGRLYRMSLDAEFEVEEQGTEKIVLLREGWYRDDYGGEFCQFQVRYVIYRDSPVFRVFHTWIYTGNSSRDRITNMGWRLPFSGPIQAGGFLSSFGEGGKWLTGDYLLQYDYNAFAIGDGGLEREHIGGRSPGVARAEVAGVAVYFGSRDFWQSFPSELEFADDSLWFHSWPRHGRPISEEALNPDYPVLLRFAHEGEVLDLRLPDAYAEGNIDASHCRAKNESDRVWENGQPDSINAQGVARTEEFWLSFSDTSGPAINQRKLLAGIQEETLRAVVDPEWVIGTEVFYEAHHQDWDNYPDFEEAFQASSLEPLKLIEDAGLYGMWLHGEVLWDWSLRSLYRALRKNHGSYGRLSWMPYARSGDPRLLKWQDAALRRIIDANYCHYVSDDVARTSVGKGDIERRSGFWAQGPLPWAGFNSPWYIRNDSVQVHHFWSGWYMNNYHRARDMAWTYIDGAKNQAANEPHVAIGGFRGNEATQKSFVDSYEATFDPWFLPWIDAIARLHRDVWGKQEWSPYARHWMPGAREYHRFSGCREHAEFYVDFVRSSDLSLAGALSYASLLGSDPQLIRRAVAEIEYHVDTARASGAGGRVDQGAELPMILGMFERLGEKPLPLNTRFVMRLTEYEETEDGEFVFRTVPIAILKEGVHPIPLALNLVRAQTFQRPNDTRTYWLYGPDGELVDSGDFSVGTYDTVPGIDIEIPANGPEGVYWLLTEIRSRDPDSPRGVSRLRGIYMPVSPMGTPEIIVLPDAQVPHASAGAFHFTPSLSFFVPEGVESFTIQSIESQHGSAIRNPDGDRVWYSRGSGRASATIDVPPEHRGKVWSIRGGEFVMDEQIPFIYAIDPDRWFDVTEIPMPEYE